VWPILTPLSVRQARGLGIIEATCENNNRTAGKLISSAQPGHKGSPQVEAVFDAKFGGKTPTPRTKRVLLNTCLTAAPNGLELFGNSDPGDTKFDTSFPRPIPNLSLSFEIFHY
jgi:hypothetical protein